MSTPPTSEETFDFTIRIRHVPGKGYEFMVNSRIANDSFMATEMCDNIPEAAAASIICLKHVIETTSEAPVVMRKKDET